MATTGNEWLAGPHTPLSSSIEKMAASVVLPSQFDLSLASDSPFFSVPSPVFEYRPAVTSAAGLLKDDQSNGGSLRSLGASSGSEVEPIGSGLRQAAYRNNSEGGEWPSSPSLGRSTPQMLFMDDNYNMTNPVIRDRSHSALPYLPPLNFSGTTDPAAEMEKMVALARQLSISGVLREGSDPAAVRVSQPGGTCRSYVNPRAVPQLQRNMPIREVNYGRSRNYSLPEITHNPANMGRDRDHRQRNPYGPSGNDFNGGGDHLPANPYADHQTHLGSFSRNGFGNPCRNTGRMRNGTRNFGPLSHFRQHNPLLRSQPNTDFFESANNHSTAAPVERNQQLVIVRSFGEHGPLSGQFNMPQGLCLGVNDEIIVADTLSHRIQIFDKNGKFMFLWGCPGVKKGQLWHPRKVAFIQDTQHIVVSDRVNGCSRIQIFERTGQFVTTLGNLHSLRMALNTTTAGMTVYNNQIIVVEVQPPACVVLNEDGNVSYWFSLEGVMVEPSDVVVVNQKYYISDFRGHCVCVFSSWGQLIQRLGGSPDGIIRYPRGLGLSPSGNLLVADTDLNRFHVSVWNVDGPSGELVGYHGLLDTKVSHSCGIVMNQSGHVVTAVKKDHMVLMMKLQDFGNGSLDNMNGHQRGWNVNAPSFHSRCEEAP